MNVLSIFAYWDVICLSRIVSWEQLIRYAELIFATLSNKAAAIFDESLTHDIFMQDKRIPSISNGKPWQLTPLDVGDLLHLLHRQKFLNGVQTK